MEMTDAEADEARAIWERWERFQHGGFIAGPPSRMVQPVINMLVVRLVMERMQDDIEFARYFSRLMDDVGIKR